MIAELLASTVQMLSGTANPDQWLIDWVNGGEASSSGEHINEKNALNCPALKAAVTVLAEAMQTLPLEVYEVAKSGRHVPATDHPVAEMFARTPNEEMSAPVCRNKMQIDLGTYGNCYTEIQRTIRGSPVAIWPRSPKPERTKPFRNDKDGKIWYQLHDQVGREQTPVRAADMLHIPYFSLDGLIGKSPVRMLKEAIGGNQGAERFANEMFKNGGTPQGYIKHPGKLSEPAYNRLKESIGEQADHSNRHKTQILEEGMEFQGTSMDPARVQMIEVRRFLVEEIARAYRIAPHLLQDLSHGTFSNITELGRQFVIFTLSPWMNLWTGEINRKLLVPPYFCRFNAKEFLRGDPTAFAQWCRTLFAIGVLSVNDIRHEHGLNPVDDENADEYFVPLNMVPLSKATDLEWIKGKGGNSQQSDGKTPKPGAPTGGDGTTPAQPGTEPAPKEPNNMAALSAAEAVLADMLYRMERIEVHAALRAAKDPAKFLQTLEGFYVKHAATIREAIELPAASVRAAGGLAYKGVSLSQSLDAIIGEHLAGKWAALLAAAECQPAELYGRVEACVKSWRNLDNPNHVPAGSPEGGQFAPADGGGSGGDNSGGSEKTGIQREAVDHQVDKSAQEISGLSHERLVVLNPDGSVHNEVNGNRDSITLNQSEKESLEGRITLHNHPAQGYPFSRVDVENAIRNGELESHVCGPKGERYKMNYEKLSGKTPEERGKIADRVKRDFPKFDRQESEKLGPMMRNAHNPTGTIKPFSRDSAALAVHNTWTRIAEKHGFEYVGDPKVTLL